MRAAPSAAARVLDVMAAGTVVSRALGFVAQRRARRRARHGPHAVDLHRGQHRAQHHLHPAGRRRPQRGVRAAAGARHEGGRASARRPTATGCSPSPGWCCGAVTLVATLLAPLLIALYTGLSRADPADTRIATLLAFWCLPQIFFYGLYTMLGQVLNARGSFGPMMWAPVVNNLVAIAGGLLFIAFFTVDESDPTSLRARGPSPCSGRARRSASSRRRWCWCRCCAGPVSATGRGSTSAASGSAGPGTWPSGRCCSCWSTSWPTS